MGEHTSPLRSVETPDALSAKTHTPGVYTLTVRHGVRLSLVFPMRPILFAFSTLVVLAVGQAHAAPKKRPPAAAIPAAKNPTAPARATAASPDAAASGGGDSGGAQTRGPTRIDFDDRLIQGQTNKSGAVYLYDRKELKVRSMIKKRENFRDEIVGSLYDS
jgi:hypothetical protein